MVSKVLIVEDDAYLRQLFGKRLMYAGFEVVYASNGVEGLERIADERPDAVILDFQMPEMDGGKMLVELRKTGNDTPVIFITAASSTYGIPGIDAADLVLHKPIGTAELVTMVKRLLQRKNQSAV